MGNNNEIRKRMETYRTVLLAVVWIAGITGMIGGMVMIGFKGGGWSSYPLRPFGIAVLIVSIFGSIIGHFLVNVGLAIPFILLNNGDYLAAIVPEGKQLGINNIPVDKQKEGKKENEIVNYNGDTTGKIKLIVERGDNVICSAIPLEITIDKKKAFSIENASRVIDFVDNGSHSIFASLDYNTQSETINFNTDNSEIKFKLSVLGVGKIKLEKIV